MSLTEVPSAEERKNLEREAWVRDAHVMIDWLGAHPDILDEVSYQGIELGTWVYGSGANEDEKRKSALKGLRSLVRKMGKCEKDWSDNYLTVIKKFGIHKISASVYRQTICTRKVVGKEHVPEYRVAAHERDIVEWECSDPSLLKVAGS
jgi:hypothetical protein